MAGPHLNLTLLPDIYAICRLANDDAVPDWACSRGFISLTHTADELSIVCLQDNVPEQIKCERGWRCLQVAGPLDFAQTGILASLTAPLAAASVSIFAISTFDTDYLLVQNTALPHALEALRNAGHHVARPHN